MRIPYSDPSKQIIPTLGPRVRKCYEHWATWTPGDRQDD